MGCLPRRRPKLLGCSGGLSEVLGEETFESVETPARLLRLVEWGLAPASEERADGGDGVDIVGFLRLVVCFELEWNRWTLEVGTWLMLEGVCIAVRLLLVGGWGARKANKRTLYYYPQGGCRLLVTSLR